MVRVSTPPKENCSKFVIVRVFTPNYKIFFFEIFKKDYHHNDVKISAFPEGQYFGPNYFHNLIEKS